MSQHFINLNCTNCGARLDVYEDMERFACSYCGTTMLVQRRGGTVSLKSVADAIRKVQTGTDKTAAELALLRLNEDLRKANDETAKLKSQGDGRKGCSALFAISVGLLGIISFAAGLPKPGFGSWFGLFLFILSVIWVRYTWTAAPPVKLEILEARIKGIQRSIREKQQIVNR